MRTADAPNIGWLADITEHYTGESQLYLYAIKAMFSNQSWVFNRFRDAPGSTCPSRSPLLVVGALDVLGSAPAGAVMTLW
ncbi:hypothetical protein ACQP1G_16735 [Nocardia sp. CA-107356]|uniref:hypothetical protein n=1 Tax=Nocardia sp. CA-107356 TaxID=3239972 RepID=UPI003D93C45B